MVDYRTWARLLGEISREFRYLVQTELEKFTFELENWVNGLIMKPLPRDWRQQTAALLLRWEREGYQLSPQSIATLDWWIESWAARRGFLPKSSVPEALAAAEDAIEPVELQSETSTDTPDTNVVPEPRKVPSAWPALTAGEEEAAQRSTGLPWWYPFQPRNRFDTSWQHRFTDWGRETRDRLRDFFQEVALLGRMSLGLEPSEDVDLEPLIAQHAKVQAAYDRYIQAKTEIYRRWNVYLSMEWFIGPEVIKVFQKIDNELPNRVEGLKSPFDDKLKAARRATYEATEKKRRRTDAAYVALDWADKVITAIEIVTLIGSVKVAIKKTFEKALVKGLSRAAARRVAIAYGVAQLATAAASAAVVAGLLPRVLSEAGLDEAEVRAGLAIFRALFTLVGLRSMAKGKPRLGRLSKAESKSAKRFLKALPMKQGRAVEVGRPYPHKQVHIHKPKGKGYWKVDYYDPVRREIISFKDSQLARVKPKTAIRYLQELARKYRPGRKIADVPSTDRSLVGKELEGRMILEVPVQKSPVPQAILDAAKELEIQIRDTDGRVY